MTLKSTKNPMRKKRLCKWTRGLLWPSCSTRPRPVKWHRFISTAKLNTELVFDFYFKPFLTLQTLCEGIYYWAFLLPTVGFRIFTQHHTKTHNTVLSMENKHLHPHLWMNSCSNEGKVWCSHKPRRDLQEKNFQMWRNLPSVFIFLSRRE